MSGENADPTSNLQAGEVVNRPVLSNTWTACTMVQRLHAKTEALPELDELVYALDSTTIDLCLNLFPWADFRTTKAAIKLMIKMEKVRSIAGVDDFDFSNSPIRQMCKHPR